MNKQEKQAAALYFDLSFWYVSLSEVGMQPAIRRSGVSIMLNLLSYIKASSF